MIKLSKSAGEKQHPVYFDAKELGESLEEVAADVIQTESQNILSRWFHSNKDVDLFIWFDEKKNIIKQQLSFCGQVVEWNILDGVKTGYIFEEESPKNQTSKGSELIQFDNTPQKTSIHFALKVLHNVSLLQDTTKGTLLNNFQKSPKVSEMDPQAFVDKYGHRQAMALQQTSFFKAFVKKIKRFLTSA